jgi:glycosyltransferase involved in cell wall biosynthesis
MRLGFDAKRLFSNFTGLGNYSRTLLANLADRYPGEEYFLYAPRLVDRAETSRFLQDPPFRPRRPGAVLKPFWRSFSIKKDLEKDGIRLFHGLSHEIPFNLHKTRIKSVVTIHDLIFKIYPGTYPLADRSIYDLKCRYACRHADRIVAISASTKQDIVRFYRVDPARIEVIPPAGNPRFFHLPPVESLDRTLQRHALPAQFLLYVGSVIERKNLLGVVEAYRHLPRDLWLPLLVAGKGKAYKQKVQAAVRQAGLEPYVLWIEDAPDDELQALYRKASILIYPSFYEGFGLPVTEALLSGTPVITSNVSSLPEAGGPGSWYVDPHRPEAIAAGIERILTDRGLREKMVETGLAYARQQFGAEGTAERLMKLYCGVLGS